MSNKGVAILISGTLILVFLLWFITEQRRKGILVIEGVKPNDEGPRIYQFNPTYVFAPPTSVVKGTVIAFPRTSYQQSIESVQGLKTYIESEDGYKLLYNEDGTPRKEKSMQLLFWPFLKNKGFDVNREANNGRGPVDFKVSKGNDKTLIEFKRASNSHLRKNLQRQTEVYSQANDNAPSITVIFAISLKEFQRAKRIIEEIGRAEDNSIFLIDASFDKPSASVA